MRRFRHCIRPDGRWCSRGGIPSGASRRPARPSRPYPTGPWDERGAHAGLQHHLGRHHDHEKLLVLAFNLAHGGRHHGHARVAVQALMMVMQILRSCLTSLPSLSLLTVWPASHSLTQALCGASGAALGRRSRRLLRRFLGSRLLLSVADCRQTGDAERQRGRNSAGAPNARNRGVVRTEFYHIALTSPAQPVRPAGAPFSIASRRSAWAALWAGLRQSRGLYGINLDRQPAPDCAWPPGNAAIQGPAPCSQHGMLVSLGVPMHRPDRSTLAGCP